MAHIATIPKNKLDEIRVGTETFRGRPFVDVRVYTAFTGSGEPLPTKKGVAIRPDQLPDLIEALQKALRQVQAG